MSILKFIKNDDRPSKGEDFGRKPERLPSNHNVSQKPSFFRSIALGTGLFLLVVGIFANFFMLRNSGNKVQPFVYFEVKAVSESGHPIAGAKVYSRGKVVGVTDSYGDWRKYMRVRPGSTVKLSFRKQLKKASLIASKNFAIPNDLNAKKIEVGGPIKMFSTRARQKPKQRLKDHVQREKLTSRRSPNHSDAKIQAEPNIWFQVLVGQDLIDTKGQKASHVLEKYLIPELKRQSQRAGYKLRRNSENRIILQHVESIERPNFRGLIRITHAAPHAKKNKFSFLKNYTGRAQITAASILKTLRVYTKASATKTRIERSWKKHRLKIGGVDEKPLNIFVGGHQATYLGNNIWQYWAAPNSSAYLTILKKGSIVHRKLIQVRRFVNLALTAKSKQIIF